MLRVPACAIENGYTTMCLTVDNIGYLVVLLRENKELYRLASTIDDVVEYISYNK